jgi:hypothetical protein
MTVLKNGFVGIGTSAPIAVLDVSATNTMILRVTNSGTPSTSSGGGISGYLSTIPTAANQRLGYYTLGAFDSTVGRNAVAIQGYSSQAWVSGSALGSYLVFQVTPNNSTSRPEVMRIAQNGYVGIGTTNPQTILDVNGSTYVRGRLIVTGTLVGGTVVASGSNLALVPQQGDLSMGSFTAGATPQ